MVESFRHADVIWKKKIGHPLKGTVVQSKEYLLSVISLPGIRTQISQQQFDVRHISGVCYRYTNEEYKTYT